MKALNFILIKITLCLITGIYISKTWDLSLTISVASTLCLLIALTFVFFIQRKSHKNRVWFGCLGFATLISLGALIENLHKDLNQSTHFFYSEAFQKQEANNIILKIKEVLKSNTFSDRYVVSVLKVNGEPSFGDALLLVKKDSVHYHLKVDDLVFSHSTLNTLRAPSNPGQFDYRAYLHTKQIYSLIYGDHQNLLKIGKQSSLRGLAETTRNHIQNKLAAYSFSKDEQAVINALLLGQRNDISSDLYNTYTNAGAIHILAISGLHVGIILLLLQWILKPLEYLKHGRVYKTILIVILIWSFAVMTGLSASVTRAATMFTAITIGLNLNRPTNTLNSLAISAFVLLILKPSLLFEVGFQLSYLAVIGIVLFQPIFDRLLPINNKILKKLWQAATVSVSAQFGILPITLFYFHQFPGLFILSNLVVIPLLGLILGLGLLTILMALFNIPQNPVANLFGTSIDLMNQFFGWIATQDPFLIKNIYFNMVMVLLSYLIIIFFYKLIEKPLYRRAIGILCCIILLQLSFIYAKYQNQKKNQFIVFHKNRQSIFALKKGRQLHLFSNDSSGNLYFLKDFKTEKYIKKVFNDSVQALYSFNGKDILVVDSTGCYDFKTIHPEIVVLKESPKINLNRLIDLLKPKQIIADGSNYKSYIKRWKESCKKEKLPFHATGEKGAFIINLN